MAENDQDRNTDDLSEEVSSHRVEEMRSQGRVAQSRELTGVFLLLCAMSVLAVGSSFFYETWLDYLRKTLLIIPLSALKVNETNVLVQAILGSGHMLLLSAGPILGVCFVAAVIGSISQVGFIFSFDPIQFNFQKIDPISGLQRLFAGKQWIELFRYLFKLIIVILVGYLVLKNFFLGSALYYDLPITELWEMGSKRMKILYYSLVFVAGLFAGIDFWLQRKEYSKSVRLTRQEAKQESKEHDGDPLVKARIRSIQREMNRKRMMSAVKKADVIITNPTHIAVALKYDRDKMSAPKVVAKGADFIAQKIKHLAAEAGVPTVENVPLARALFKSVKIGQVVPQNLYQAVAEVLAYVYRLKGKKF